MRDQREVWERNYQREGPLAIDAFEFAQEAAALLTPGSRVLELGCGVGIDAAYFARMGHQVLAVDFAQPAIYRARVQHKDLVDSGKLTFDVADMAKPLRITGDFNLVYARLSLHYFLDTRTRALFGEIAALLPPDGLLAFMCKSLDDPLYGKGTEVEPDVFESNHVRHFFTEAYARECLEPYFEVVELQSIRGPLYGDESAYVKSIARRR